RQGPRPGARTWGGEVSSRSPRGRCGPQACLFRLDGRRFDDRRPARDLVFDQRRERLLTAPGLVRNFAAEAEQALLRSLVIERLVERVAELVEDRLRRPLGCEQGVPGRCLEL